MIVTCSLTASDGCSVDAAVLWPCHRPVTLTTPLKLVALMAVTSCNAFSGSWQPCGHMPFHCASTVRWCRFRDPRPQLQCGGGEVLQEGQDVCGGAVLQLRAVHHLAPGGHHLAHQGLGSGKGGDAQGAVRVGLEVGCCETGNGMWYAADDGKPLARLEHSGRLQSLKTMFSRLCHKQQHMLQWQHRSITHLLCVLTNNKPSCTAQGRMEGMLRLVKSKGNAPAAECG
jgi:hypothetical protein